MDGFNHLRFAFNLNGNLDDIILHVLFYHFLQQALTIGITTNDKVVLFNALKHFIVDIIYISVITFEVVGGIKACRLDK